MLLYTPSGNRRLLLASATTQTTISSPSLSLSLSLTRHYTTMVVKTIYRLHTLILVLPLFSLPITLSHELE